MAKRVSDQPGNSAVADPIPATATNNTLPATKAKRPRMPFLDGIRGLAALYVVMNHASIMGQKMIHDAPNISPHVAKILHILHFYFFDYGVYAVDTFIVLSGYCLMLPVATSPGETLTGGFWGFMKRRARRIVPPYYAALALCWLFFALAGPLKIDVGAMSWSDVVHPVFSVGSVVTHIFLIHCWTPWRSTIDPPMWSVATEWNIYFLFPLLLLPVFKKWGSIAALAVAFGIGILPHYLIPGGDQIDKMYPWYLGLFTLGMIGAVVNFSPRSSARAFGDKVPWGLLTVGFGALLAVITSLQRESLQHSRIFHWFQETTWGTRWPLDVLAGLTAICLIGYCAKKAIDGKSETTPLVKFFDAKPMMALGAFSYSIYLFHAPVIEVMWLGIKKTMAAQPGALLFLALAAPVSLILGYLFHLAFEKRFMGSHRALAATASAPGDLVMVGANESANGIVDERRG